MRFLITPASLLILILLLACPPATAVPRSGWESFSALDRGNIRFAKEHQELVSLQPHAVVVTCSDPRISPELIFGQTLGELYVVRSPGLALGPEARAGVDYAVQELKAKLLVVLGSDSCSALQSLAGARSPEPQDRSDMAYLKRTLRRHLTAPHELHHPITKEGVGRQMVRSVTQELIDNSDTIRRSMQEQGLLVSEALYNMKSGRVSFRSVGKDPSQHAPRPQN